MKKLLLPEGYDDTLWLENQLRSRPPDHWAAAGERRALKLFHDMAGRVPAYRDFLRKHSINPQQIRTINDFAALPLVSKDNYLRHYPLEMLCWDGQFGKDGWVISTTSGSTGKPFYFPRQDTQDWQYAVTAELYLRANFNIQHKSTLYIVAFPMGAWIGGLFTYEALKIVAETGRYDLSIITPGIHKKEIIETVKQLGHSFDQIIIGSYAPFLKDILDDGEREGLNWKDYDLGFVFSAEGFNEVFRDFVIRKAGLKNAYTGTLNHYGTVDLGTMAHETPLSVYLRRQAMSDNDFYTGLFGRQDKLPTYCQYNPELFYFEEHGGTLICSAYSGIPLVRYDLKDSGGVASFDEVEKLAAAAGYDLARLAAENGFSHSLWNLPFVHVYERNDFSVSFYAFQIYPETIRRALQADSLDNYITGKFTMTVEYDENGQQMFIINAELKPHHEPSEQLIESIQAAVVDTLLRESSEYRETHVMYGPMVYPQIVLWPYEDASYFKPGAKQQWVKKNPIA